MELTLSAATLLVTTGILVGFINTLAGGGSVISLAVFTAMGMPIQLANGTNRIAIMAQALTASATFLGKKLLDWRGTAALCVSVAAGTVVGSRIAVTIDERIFQICLAVVLAGVLFFTLAGERIIKSRRARTAPRVVQWLVFFLIGIYSGYMFVGMGYLVLLAAMGMMGMNIVRANVVKSLIVCVSVPFSILVFGLGGQIDYEWGLLHGAGNAIGAFLASKFAIDWGTRFLRWFMVAVVLVCLADLAGIISLRGIVLMMLG